MTPRKPKNKYDIEEIKQLRNEGLSRRAIARAKGWTFETFNYWLNRHYKEKITIDYEER